MSPQSTLDYIVEREEDLEALRRLSLKERAGMFARACRSAVALEKSRRQMGLPPSEPDPWPESTWRFLALEADRAKNRGRAS